MTLPVLRSWVKKWFGGSNRKHRRGRRPGRRPGHEILTLAHLEDRAVPAVSVFQDGLNGYTGTQDVELRQASPGANQNASGTVLVDWDGGTVNSHGLLRFDDIFGTGPGQVPTGAFIKNAYLTLYTTNPGDGGQFYRMTTDWAEDTATWNSLSNGIDIGTDTAPEREGFAGNDAGNNDVASGGFRTFNVIDSLRAWQAGAPNYGWGMIGWTSRTDGWEFEVSEEAAFPERRPSLTVEWEIIPGSQQVRFQQGVGGYAGTVDTYLQENVPAADNSTIQTVFVDERDTNSTNRNEVLIRFDDVIGNNPGQIPVGSTILSATLQLSSNTSSSQGDGGQFLRLLQPFSATDNWGGAFGGNGVQADNTEAASNPNTIAGVAARNADPQSNRNVFDVTYDLQAWASGETNNGWAIIPWTSGTDGWGFQTSDAANVGDRPGLIVNFIPPTGAGSPTASAVPDVVVTEDAAPVVIDLSTYFTDPQGDTLTYGVAQTNSNGLVATSVAGKDLTLTFAPDQYGYSYLRVSATDPSGNTASTAIEVFVNPDGVKPDTGATNQNTVVTIPVLANDSDGTIRAVEAANIDVVQNDTGNATTSVTVTTPQGTPDFQIRSGSNRADYNVQIGAIATDDPAQGLLVTTVRENGRDNGELDSSSNPLGKEYPAAMIDADSGGYFIPIHNVPSGGEYNVNPAAAHFGYSHGWVGGWVANLTGTNDGPNNTFRSGGGGAASLTVGPNPENLVRDLGNGQTNVRIPGVNSQTDGLLITVGGKNEDNRGLVTANADGSWQILNRDTDRDDADTEQDPVGFVYVPRNVPNVVSGRILGDGSVELASGKFAVTKTDVGTYQLSINGQTPTSGVLLLAGEGGGTLNADNVVSYQASGSNFIIETRDIQPGGASSGLDPVLEDVGATEGVVSFAFIPFLTDAEFATVSAQNTAGTTPNVSDKGATLTVNGDGTVNYDPTTSTAIQNLTPGQSLTDTFTYTAVNRFGVSSTAAVTVSVTVPLSSTVDLAAGVITFDGAAGGPNAVTVSETGGVFSIADASGNITLTQAAKDAGFTGSGTGKVSGPASALSAFVINGKDLPDTITVDNVSKPFTIDGGGDVGDKVVVASTSTVGGDVTITGVDDITAAPGATLVSTGGKITLTAANGIGTASENVRTQAATVNATAGAGGVFVTEADGATVTLAATSTGVIEFTNTAGTLGIAKATTAGGSVTITGADGTVNVDGPVSGAGGKVTISSGDALNLNADLDAGSGTVALAANTDGAGPEGYDQKGASVVTTSTAADALTITVNTAGGGTGNAVVGKGLVGSDAGGKVTVNSHGGSILWSSDPSYAAFTPSQTGLGNAGGNTQTLRAREYSFLATGSGGVGTDPRPVQIDNWGPNSAAANPPNVTADVGTGGVFVVGWDASGSRDLTTGDIIAAGGDVRVVSANAGGHNLWVAGNVKTAGGNIFLGADDNVTVGANVTIGGAGFGGEVTVTANRDRGTAGQSLTMDKTSAIVTGNTGPNAVRVEIFGDAGTQSTLTVGSITTGNGGTITLDATPESLVNEAGRIVMADAANLLDPGANGTVVLRGGNTGTSVSDTFGNGTTPIRLAGGTVNVVSSKNASAFVTSAGAAKFQAAPQVAGGTGGNLTFATEAGELSLAGPVSTDGGAITLTAPGGVGITAALGDADSGAVTINGTTTVATGITFAPLSTTTVTGTTTVPAGATLSPSDTAAGTFTANGLNAAGGTVAIDLNGITPGAQYDQIILNSGTADITGAVLNLTTSNALTVGDSFTLIANNTGTPVTGQFASGTMVNSNNNPAQEFTIDYAGGAGGTDVVVTLTSVVAGNVLTVAGGKLLYGAAAGANNGLVVNLNGANYEITDSAPITLTAQAVAAGWTGSGTNTVTGPSASVNELFFNTGDGTDTITLTDLDDPFTVTGGGDAGDTATINGVLTFTGDASISGVETVTAASGSLIETPTGTVTLTASGAVGTAANRVATRAGAVVATAGAGGVFMTESDGADLTATTTGGGVDVVNAAGTLTVVGVGSANGAVSLASADALVVAGDVNAGSGTIALAANTNGAGAEGLTQTAGTITTTNDTADAASLVANTFGGGTGNVSIDSTAVGTGSAGRLTVTSNAGSILYAGTDPLTASQRGTVGGGGAPGRVLVAREFFFTATGAGSVGTDDRPIQSSIPVVNVPVVLSAGSGGVYWTDWTADMVLAGATATGAGSIRVVTGNAGGHDLIVVGNVTTETGNIFLASDDNLIVGPDVTIGGDFFDGTVWLESNRDQGTAGQPLTMDPTSKIITNSTANVDTPNRDQTTQAVMLRANGDPGNPSTISLGDVILNNAGGRVVVNAIPNGIAAEAGRIQMATAVNFLQVPGGVIDLTAGITNGAVADAIGAADKAINATTGRILFNSNNGNVWLASEGLIEFSGQVTAQSGQTSPATVTATSQSEIAVVGDTATVNDGPVVLTAGSGGGGGGKVTIASGVTLGSATTGPITVTAALTGAGAITLGGGDLTVTQSADSTHTGVISNASAPRGVVKNGGGVLTLSGANTYNGATAVNEGQLKAGSTSAFGQNSAVTLVNATGVVLNLDNLSVSIGSLSGGGASGGNVTLGSGTLTTGGNGASTSFGGVINGTGKLVKEGAGTQTLSGSNTYTGATTVSGGTLRVNGGLAAASAVTVGTGGTLDGTGTVGGPVTANGTLGVGAGAAAGQLATGAVAFGTDGVLRIDVLGTTVGTQYDRLNVTGLVNLTGAQLDLNLGSFSPAVGQTFRVVENDSNDAVVGTFDGLAEGAEFTVGSSKFQVTYAGGDGNDVVLTRVADTPAPQVTGVLVNGTTAPSASYTASRVTSLVVTFNTPVTLAPGAFGLLNTSTGQTITSAAGGGILVSVSGAVVTLTFDPAVAGVEFGSLADGVWTLTTDLTRVRNASNAAGTGTATTGDIRRLFGDANGDGTVDGTDFAGFGATWGQSEGDPGFDPTFDANGDGTIDGTDFAEFGNRWGVSL